MPLLGIRYLVVCSAPACKRAGSVVPILLDGSWVVVNALLVVYNSVCAQVAPALAKCQVSMWDAMWLIWSDLGIVGG